MEDKLENRIFYLVSVNRIEDKQQGTLFYQSVYSNGLSKIVENFSLNESPINKTSSIPTTLMKN